MDVKQLLVCPTCHGPLEWREAEVLCHTCAETYRLIDGIPFMVAEAEREATGRAPFDAIAPVYDRTLPHHVTEHYLNKRVKFIGEHVKGGPVLDVGGGTGVLARRLLDAGYQVVGADASLGMLRVYHSRTSTLPVGALAHALPFRSQTFQGVVCVALLHHIAQADPVRATLGEMYRVLRRGGSLVIWDHNPANPYWPVLMEKVPQDSGHERLIPLREIRRGLRPLGCASVQVYKKGFVPDFAPPALLPLIQWLEQAMEAIPLVRGLAAHNVVVVRKE